MKHRIILSVMYNQLEEYYKNLQINLCRGWNTWNPKSVLSHVFLPQKLNIQLCVKNTFITGNQYLKDAYISAKEVRPEKITPGLHAIDGSYTELTVLFEGSEFRVETATVNDDLVIKVSVLSLPWKTPNLIIEMGMLWNADGNIQLYHDCLIAETEGKKIPLYITSKPQEDYIPTNCHYLSVPLDGEIGISTGKHRTVPEISEILKRSRTGVEQKIASYAKQSDAYEAMQSVLAWNLIYDPFHNRAIVPVSRLWNDFFEGPFVLFDWDTYFGALMLSEESRELAYANAVAITKHITPGGFIPNYVGGYGLGSHDRSQPPVGSYVFLKLYEKFKEKWILDFVFNELLCWNRWWNNNRNNNGLLCWGSDPLPEPNNGDCNNWQAAAYETGLDNSPMYDNVPFNTETHIMELADAGLMGIYVWDCDNLAQIAEILGRETEKAELIERAQRFRENLSQLWSEKDSIYLNKRTDTGKFSYSLSPTLFYPLLAKAPTQQQAERMINQHFMNEEEFMGDFILPSIAKNDPAYLEQGYWRGRIWGPMNFLVYLGLKNYNLPEAKKILVEKSHALLMKTWKKNRMVHENYNGITGNGRNEDERINLSDSYYHWGALFSYITLIEKK